VTGNPLTLLAVMCWLSGVRLVSLGFLGEMSTLYYQRSGRRPYVVENAAPEQPPLRSIKPAA
jgi:hypothetical protein